MFRFIPQLNQLEARETPTSIPPVDPITPLPGPPPAPEPVQPGPYTPEPPEVKIDLPRR